MAVKTKEKARRNNLGKREFLPAVPPDGQYVLVRANRHTKKCSPAIETRQVDGQNITLATPRKVSFDSHHECRNINRSRNDSPTPPVCSLQSAICISSI